MGSSRTSCPPALAHRFRVERRLGEGGMGAVFLGYQPGLDRKVALKVLKVADPDPGAVARFENEARALAAVEHPNMVRIHDFGQDGDLVYLVMEYVRGPSLAYMIHKEGRLPVRDAQTILFCVGEALQAIHDAGMLHRDVKPDNIMVDSTGRPVLMDLGLARPDARSGAEDTLHDKAVGTLLYMAPEIARRQGGVTGSDWYSWGATLYECLDGDAPLDRAEVVRALRSPGSSWPLPPRPACPPEGEALAALAGWCLRAHPEKRPSSFRDIQEVMSGERQAPVPAWSTTAPREDRDRRSVRRRLRRKRGKGRSPALLAGGLLAAGAALAGLAHLTQGGSASRSPEAVRLRLRALGEGRLTAYAPGLDGGGALLLEDGDRPATVVVPLGRGPGEPFHAPLPFRAAVRIGDRVGPWTSYPPAPAALPRPVDYELVPGGLLLFGEGPAPEPGWELAAEGLRPRRPDHLDVHPPLWVARFSVDSLARARRPRLVEPGDGGPFERVSPLPWESIPTDRTELEDLLAYLRDHASFVTEGGRGDALLQARERWLKLRAHALGAWHQLESTVRRRFREVLLRLIREEEGLPRWSRATAFVADLALLDPIAAEVLGQELREGGVPAEWLESRRALRAPRALARLRHLAGGDGRDLDRLGIEGADRGVAGMARRGAFLPSPLAGARAERWIAWALWGRWAAWSVEDPLGRSSLFSNLARSLQERERDRAGSQLFPFLPFDEGRQAPRPSRVRWELDTAWERLGQSNLRRKQALAPLLLEGLLPERDLRAPREQVDRLVERVLALARPHLDTVRSDRLRGFQRCVDILAPFLRDASPASRGALDGLRARWSSPEAP